MSEFGWILSVLLLNTIWTCMIMWDTHQIRLQIKKRERQINGDKP